MSQDLETFGGLAGGGVQWSSDGEKKAQFDREHELFLGAIRSERMGLAGGAAPPVSAPQPRNLGQVTGGADEYDVDGFASSEITAPPLPNPALFGMLSGTKSKPPTGAAAPVAASPSRPAPGPSVASSPVPARAAAPAAAPAHAPVAAPAAVPTGAAAAAAAPALVPAAAAVPVATPAAPVPFAAPGSQLMALAAVPPGYPYPPPGMMYASAGPKGPLFVVPMPFGMPHPGMPHPGMPHPGMPHPGMPHPGMPHPGMPHPGMPHPGMPHPGMPHPGPYGSGPGPMPSVSTAGAPAEAATATATATATAPKGAAPATPKGATPATPKGAAAPSPKGAGAAATTLPITAAGAAVAGAARVAATPVATAGPTAGPVTASGPKALPAGPRPGYLSAVTGEKPTAGAAAPTAGVAKGGIPAMAHVGDGAARAAAASPAGASGKRANAGAGMGAGAGSGAGTGSGVTSTPSTPTPAIRVLTKPTAYIDSPTPAQAKALGANAIATATAAAAATPNSPSAASTLSAGSSRSGKQNRARRGATPRATATGARSARSAHGARWMSLYEQRSVQHFQLAGVATFNPYVNDYYFFVKSQRAAEAAGKAPTPETAVPGLIYTRAGQSANAYIPPEMSHTLGALTVRTASAPRQLLHVPTVARANTASQQDVDPMRLTRLSVESGLRAMLAIGELDAKIRAVERGSVATPALPTGASPARTTLTPADAMARLTAERARCVETVVTAVGLAPFSSCEIASPQPKSHVLWAFEADRVFACALTLTKGRRLIRLSLAYVTASSERLHDLLMAVARNLATLVMDTGDVRAWGEATRLLVELVPHMARAEPAALLLTLRSMLFCHSPEDIMHVAHTKGGAAFLGALLSIGSAAVAPTGYLQPWHQHCLFTASLFTGSWVRLFAGAPGVAAGAPEAAAEPAALVTLFDAIDRCVDDPTRLAILAEMRADASGKLGSFFAALAGVAAQRG